MTNRSSHPFGHEDSPALSRAGLERRDELLVRLHVELDRRVARRRTARATGGVAILMIALGAAALWFPAGGAVTPRPPSVPEVVLRPAREAPVAAPAPSPVSAPSSLGVIAIITPDADVVRRLSISGTGASVEIISDAALQHELAAAGIDPGLVTIAGRTTVALAGPPTGKSTAH
jgi:hypothetical protein